MLNTLPTPLPAPVTNTISPLTSLRPRGMKKRNIDSIQNANAMNVEAIIFNMIAIIVIMSKESTKFSTNYEFSLWKHTKYFIKALSIFLVNPEMENGCRLNRSKFLFFGLNILLLQSSLLG